MRTVNNQMDLMDVLANLDFEEHIAIRIGKHTMDLWYLVDEDCFSMFDNCEINFDTLGEMENYIVRNYGLC